MTNAADDYAAIRRAMREHEEAELANWLAMRLGDSVSVTISSAEVWSVDYDPKLYSFTNYVWPDPKA